MIKKLFIGCFFGLSSFAALLLACTTIYPATDSILIYYGFPTTSTGGAYWSTEIYNATKLAKTLPMQLAFAVSGTNCAFMFVAQNQFEAVKETTDKI